MVAMVEAAHAVSNNIRIVFGIFSLLFASKHHWGKRTSKQVGDHDHIEEFATRTPTETWFEEPTRKALPSSIRFRYDGPCGPTRAASDDIRRAV